MRFPVIGCIAIKLIMDHIIKKHVHTLEVDPRYKPKLDISYIEDDENLHKFNVFYAPRRRNNICVIDIHGGAYLFGHRNQNYKFAVKFLENGFDMISIDYIPNIKGRNTIDIIKDCAACIDYISTHIKELGLENDKFVLTGDSAGGHMAILVAEMLGNEELCIKNYGKPIKFDIKGLMVNCPTYHYVKLGVETMGPLAQKYMLGPNYKDFDARVPLSPKENVKSIKVPVFLSTASRDFLRNESVMFRDDMVKNNLKHVFIDVDSDEKKFMHVHNKIYVDLYVSEVLNKEMMMFAIECCE